MWVEATRQKTGERNLRKPKNVRKPVTLKLKTEGGNAKGKTAGADAKEDWRRNLVRGRSQGGGNQKVS